MVSMQQLGSLKKLLFNFKSDPQNNKMQFQLLFSLIFSRNSTQIYCKGALYIKAKFFKKPLIVILMIILKVFQLDGR